VASSHSARTPNTWTAAGIALLLLGATVAVSGGFATHIGHLRVSVGRVVPECLLGWLLIAWRIRHADAAAADRSATAGFGVVRTHATLTVSVLIAMTFAAGLAFGAFTAAGADPSGYISQAGLWASGNPVRLQPRFVVEAPWPDAEWSFAPLGYKPSTVPGVLVPTYAAGFPLQMAALWRVLGAAGACLVVPALGAITVWLTFSLALMVCAPEVALVAALLVACGPVFLFHLVQPMSDVPVSAWWLAAVACAVRRSSGAVVIAGLCASVAILTRPNLLPLVVPLAAFAALMPWEGLQEGSRRVLLLALGTLPGVALVAAIDSVFYGSPTASGYGSVGTIFHLSYFTANVVRYPVWLWRAYSPYALGLCVLPFLSWLPARFSSNISGPSRRFGWLSVGFVAALAVCYVFYIPFDHWMYLRFLLPGIPLLLIGTSALLDGVLQAWPARWRAVGLAATASCLPILFVSTANHAGVPRLEEEFRQRFLDVAVYVEAHTAPGAVLVSLNESGSLHYYTGRTILRYDILHPESLVPAIEYLQARGHDTYLALEQTELPEFQSRFGAPAGGRLIQRPVAALGEKNRVLLFRLEARP
jgi:hypothetical protein